MKKQHTLLALILLVLTLNSAAAQEPSDIISLYKGSKLIFDDKIGFETHYYLSDKTTVKSIDGKMRRQFCSVPEGVSTLEIIKNYEKAISAKGGTIIYFARDAYRFTDPKTGKRVWFMRDLFTKGRPTRYNQYGYMQLPHEAEDYVVGKIATPAHDIFISVASAVVENVTYYTLVTVEVEPMDMQNVTLNVINEGIAGSGKVAIYDIYFDTGKSEIKHESSNALTVIADYLKAHADQKFLIVGHTDNTGDFESNIKLSKARAEAVINKLVSDYGISKTQLIPYGNSSASPQMSNATEEGRARNRRVELVEF